MLCGLSLKPKTPMAFLSVALFVIFVSVANYLSLHKVQKEYAFISEEKVEYKEPDRNHLENNEVIPQTKLKITLDNPKSNKSAADVLPLHEEEEAKVGKAEDF